MKTYIIAGLMSWVLECQLKRSQLDRASLWFWSQDVVMGIQEKPSSGEDFFAPQKGNEVVEYQSSGHAQEKDWLKEERYLENHKDLVLHVFVSDMTEIERKSFAQECCQFLKDSVQLKWSSLSEVDYIEEYKKNVQASEFGEGLWVGAPWMEVPKGKTARFVVDPGMAFGTGEHPTTQMCLEKLHELSRDPREKSLGQFLDLGCGTGILSLGVRKFFPQASLVASDLDPLCQEEFAKNFRLNDCSSSDIVQFWGADAQCSELLKKNYSFDCVVSNIYAEILADLSDCVFGLLRKGGIWLASGILEGQSSEKLLQAVPPGMRLLEKERRFYKGEYWLCCMWKKE